MSNCIDLPEEQKPTPENMTMLQGFEWYVPDDKKHWKRLAGQASQLKATGVDNIWIPPGCKASSPSGNGYDIYDLYDLGEFDQKGSKATKWGTKDELLDLVNSCNEAGVGVYWDAGEFRDDRISFITMFYKVLYLAGLKLSKWKVKYQLYRWHEHSIWPLH